MLDISEVSNGYKVKFAYRPFLVDAIKKIPGARYNANEKQWWVPSHSGTALLNWAGSFKTTITKAPPEIEIGEIPPLPELTIDIPLKKTLYPYQKTGVAYLLEHNRCIIGDKPGLGKTAQAIALMQAVKARCILVICPATIKENWAREWKMWTGETASIMNDRIRSTWVHYYKVMGIRLFITNYESLKKFFVEKIDKPESVPLRLNHIKFKECINLFDAVIIDELHRCKDGKTQQAKFTMGITKGKKYVLGLTGTPVVNKPMDLLSQLHIVGHLQTFGGYKIFVERYCAGSKQASNLKELNFLLNKHCFYQREKQDVLKELPDKVREIYTCEIENRKEYDKAEADLAKYLKENLGRTDQEISKSMRGEIMVRIGILKKISARGKVNDVIEHCRDIMDAGEKVVVFAWHKDIVHELKENIPGCVTLVGDDSLDQRQRSVDTFQTDPAVKVIICNIKSGGVGITLTASSRVCFIELPWHSADSDQCEDRCHRIGQKNSVQSTFFLGHNTIDEDIYEIIEKKRKIAAEITGAEEEVETNMVDDFINLFRTKHNI